MSKGKRFTKAAKDIDRLKSYPLADAVKMVKSGATAKDRKSVV